MTVNDKRVNTEIKITLEQYSWNKIFLKNYFKEVIENKTH